MPVGLEMIKIWVVMGLPVLLLSKYLGKCFIQLRKVVSDGRASRRDLRTKLKALLEMTFS